MDVTLPSGHVITDVPEDFDPVELARIAIDNKLATVEDFADYDLGPTTPQPEGGFWGDVKDAGAHFAKGFVDTAANMVEGDVALANAATNFVGLDDLIDEGKDNEAIRFLDNLRDTTEGWVDPQAGHFDQFMQGLGSAGAFVTSIALSPFGKARQAVNLGKEGGKWFSAMLRGQLSKETAQNLAKGYSVPLAIAGSSGAGEQAQMIRAAREQGTEIGEGQELAALLGGTAVGFTEIAPLERLFKGLPPDAVKGMMPRIKKALITGGAEGVQEVSAGLMQDAIAKGIYNPDQPIGDSAWQEFITGGEVGTLLDLVFTSIAGRRRRGITDQQKAHEESLRGIEQERQAELAQRFEDLPPTPTTTPLALPPPESTGDPLQDAQRSAEAIEAAQGDLFPISGWRVTETQLQDGSTRFYVQDINGQQVSQDFADPEPARALVGALTERGVNRAALDSATLSVDNTLDEYDPGTRASLVSYGLRLLHPNTNMLNAAQVNYAARTTSEHGYLHENMSLEEAEQAGVKPEELTAAQKINLQRRRAKLPASNKFSVEEAASALGNNLGRLAEARLLPVAQNEQFQAQLENGKPVIYSRVMGKGKKPVLKNIGKAIDSRPDNDPNSNSRTPFKGLEEAKNYAAYLNQKAARNELLYGDLYAGDKITVADIRSLLKQKNVSSSLESQPVRAISKLVTGRDTPISRLSANEKALVYNRLKQLPQFENPTDLPSYGFRPYSPVHYRTARALTKERGAIPTRQELADLNGPITAREYARLAKQLDQDTNIAYERQRIEDAEQMARDEERARQQQQQERLAEQKRVQSLVEQFFDRFNLKSWGKAKVIDYARQAKLDENGELVIGERTEAGQPEVSTVEGRFRPSLQAIFIHLEAIKSNPEYQALAAKEGVTQEQLDQKLVDMAIETMNHEILHLMREADLFTLDEWRLLESLAMKTVRKGKDGKPMKLANGKDMTYADWAVNMYKTKDGYSPLVQMEEAIAELVRDGLSGRVSIGGKPKTLMLRIKEFIKGIVGLKSEGFQTFDDLISAIKTGQIGGRERGVVRTLKETEKQAVRATEETVRQVEEAEQAATADQGETPAPAFVGPSSPDYLEMVRGPAMDLGPATRGTYQDYVDMRAWHGSPHEFVLFDLNKIGTGEGVQAFGWGLYFAESKNIANYYAEGVKRIPWLNDLKDASVNSPSTLWFIEQLEQNLIDDRGRVRPLQDGLRDTRQAFTETAKDVTEDPYLRTQARGALDQFDTLAERITKAAKGRHYPGKRQSFLYEVDIPDDVVDRMLVWDRPLSEQPGVVTALNDFFSQLGDPQEVMARAGLSLKSTGEAVYKAFTGKSDNSFAQRDASLTLKQFGIPGIRYYDAASRTLSRATARAQQGFIKPLYDAITAKPDAKRTINMVLFSMDNVEPLTRNGESIKQIQLVKEQIPAAERLQKDAGLSDSMLSKRMDEAAEQGFDTNTVWYTGRKRAVSKFTGRRGADVFVTLDPTFASQYTGVFVNKSGKVLNQHLAYKETPEFPFGEAGRKDRGPVIYPLFVRVKKVFEAHNKQHIEELEELVNRGGPEVREQLLKTAMEGAGNLPPPFAIWLANKYNTSSTEAIDRLNQNPAERRQVENEWRQEMGKEAERWRNDEDLHATLGRWEISSLEALNKLKNGEVHWTYIEPLIPYLKLLGYDGHIDYEDMGDGPTGMAVYNSANVKGVFADFNPENVPEGLEYEDDIMFSRRDEPAAGKLTPQWQEAFDRAGVSDFLSKQRRIRNILMEAYPEGPPPGNQHFLRKAAVALKVSQIMHDTGHQSDIWKKYLTQGKLDKQAVGAAIFNFKRHHLTDYEELLGLGVSKDQARQAIEPQMYSRRESDPEGVADVIEQNLSEAIRSIDIHAVPKYSVGASPDAQYVARNPEAADRLTDDELRSVRQSPEYSPEAAAAIDAVVGKMPKGKHPMDNYRHLNSPYEPGKLEYTLTKWKQAAINRYARLERLNWDTELRENLADASSIAAALHADRAMGIAGAAIKYGVPVYHKGLVMVVNQKMADNLAQRGEPLGDIPGVDLSKVKGLIHINGPLHKNDWHDDLTELAKAYAVSQRARRLTAEGKIVPVTPEHRRAIEAEVLKYVDPATGENVIHKWYKEWQDYNEHVINLMRNTGILTEETARLWRMAADYFPYYRVAEGAKEGIYRKVDGVFGGFTGAVHLRRLKGGKEPVNMDLEEAMALNLTAAIQMSMKNVAQQRIVRDLIQLGLAEEVPPGVTASGPIVEFMVNGKKRRAAIYDPLVYESMQSLEGTDLVSLVRNTVGRPATFLREAVTRDPGFMLVNLLRDSLSSFTTSGASLTPVYSTLKGLFDGTETLEMMGVVGGYDYSNDPDDLKKFHAKEAARNGYGPALNMFTRAWDWLGKGTTASDAATRNAVFDDVYKKTGNFAEAAFQAQEVINFGRHGARPEFRIMSAVIPFLNARFQGMDVFMRAFTGRYTADKTKNRQQVINSALARGSLLLGATAAYYLLVGDDDQYKEQPDFIKDNYWIIPTQSGVPITLPIPFEVGLLFKTVPENVLAYFMSGKQKGEEQYDIKTGREIAESMYRGFGTTLELNPLQIQFIGPLAEAVLNHNSFTGRQIVPQYLVDNIEAGAQSQPFTQEWAKWIGETTNTSPMRWQHALEGYAGTMGMYLLEMIDLAMKDPRVSGDVRSAMPSLPWYEYPAIKRFAGDPNGRALVQDAYDLYREVSKVRSTVNALHEDGKIEDVKAYIRNRQILYSMGPGMNQLKKMLDTYRKQRNRLMQSDLSADAKREQIEALEARLNDVLKNIVPRLKERMDLPFYTPYTYSE